MTISCTAKSYCIAVGLSHCSVGANRLENPLKKVCWGARFVSPKQFLLHEYGLDRALKAKVKVLTNQIEQTQQYQPMAVHYSVALAGAEQQDSTLLPAIYTEV